MKFKSAGEFLPIGSVITLNNGHKRIMICGFLQERQEEHKIFDYCACLYPEGILASDELFLFNNEDIDQIHYIGMQDTEGFQFNDFLQKNKKNLL